MPKYGKVKRSYPLTVEGVLGKFKTEAQRLNRYHTLATQFRYNKHEIERAEQRISEIKKEQRLLLPPLCDSLCKCGQWCGECEKKRVLLLAQQKVAKKKK